MGGLKTAIEGLETASPPPPQLIHSVDGRFIFKFFDSWSRRRDAGFSFRGSLSTSKTLTFFIIYSSTWSSFGGGPSSSCLAPKGRVLLCYCAQWREESPAESPPPASLLTTC